MRVCEHRFDTTNCLHVWVVSHEKAGQTNMRAELKVIVGEMTGQTFSLSGNRFLVGRETDCQIRPPSEIVSRHHCVFLKDDYTLRVRDLGSKNGTYVNDRRIRGEVVLVHGDILYIGDMSLQVNILQTSSPQPAVENEAAPTPKDSSNPPNQVHDGNTLPATEPYPQPSQISTHLQPPVQQAIPTPIVVVF